MKLINQEKFNKVMKGGLNALQKPNGIIRVSRKPISISQEDAANWRIPYKLYKEEPMQPKWFEEFYKEFKTFAENQKGFNKRIESDIKELKKDVTLMKNTPTMKKELNA